MELEELEEHGLKGSPEQTAQGKRVLGKLVDEWATVNITASQVLLRSPSSKSPSPSPSASKLESEGSIEEWLDSMEQELKDWKYMNDSDEGKRKLKDMDSEISKRHRYGKIV